MSIKIALAGNPNCGKTTLFNNLTGSNQYVGNWPGVTVEKKEGKLKGDKDVIIQDLPGIYSLSPYTLEEVVSRTYLVKEKPDAILNIIDGTNIERNLYLTTQLIELGIPVVMAVNMIDLVRKNGDKIDLKKLSAELGCQAVEISALKGEGTEAAAKAAMAAAKAGKAGELPHVFTGSVEHAIAHIEESIQGKVDDRFLRWYAVKLFERDGKVQEELKLPSDLMAHIDQHIKDCEAEMDDDAESIITNQRYAYINGVVDKAVKKKARVEHLTVSDKVDQIVTNRVLALPIFAVIMYLMYSLSMGTSIADGGWAIGTFATDWTNDVLFGEIVPNALGGFLEGIGVAGWLYGLIMDGIVAGVGAVLGFVPQMLVLFFLLSILEDVGYMSRVAFIMDRIFRKFGLSGKSFIPVLVGTGCGVPGVMASRTIENERDRRMTIMTTCFIPCGAKMPIIGLIAGAMFGGSSLVAVSAYFIGMAAMTRSEITIKNVSYENLGIIPESFRRLGIKLEQRGDDIFVPAQDCYQIESFIDGSIMTIADAPWPGLTPDLLSVMLVVATQAKGSVLIHQKMFESRLFFVDKLIDMGAQIILCDPHRAVVIGHNHGFTLRGGNMTSPDIRAGIALLIAAMSAEGISRIHNIEQIDRGYQNIEGRLNAIGARITRI